MFTASSDTNVTEKNILVRELLYKECSDTEPSSDVTSGLGSVCPKYKAGYFTKSQAMREISICPVNNIRLICIDRKDKLRIAKFNESTWWKV